MLKTVVLPWTKWTLEDIASTGCTIDFTKVIAFPVGALKGPVPLDHTVIAGNTGTIESSSHDATTFDIQLDINAQKRLQFQICLRHFQQVVIERRYCRCRNKPVRVHDRNQCLSFANYCLICLKIICNFVGELLGNSIPRLTFPFIVANVDTVDCF